MSGPKNPLNYQLCKARELLKFYKDRTRSQARKKGYARWKKRELISALRQLDRSATFDIFNNRLPPELRLIVYDKLKEVTPLLITHLPFGSRLNQKYSDLKNVSMTCRQAHQEVSSIIHRMTAFCIRILWQLDPKAEIKTWEKHGWHSVIMESAKIPEQWENPKSPIVLRRKDPDFGGLKYIEECYVLIHIPAMECRVRNLAEYLDYRVERDVPILFKTLSEIWGLSKNLKFFRIVPIGSKAPLPAWPRFHTLLDRSSRMLQEEAGEIHGTWTDLGCGAGAKWVFREA